MINSLDVYCFNAASAGERIVKISEHSGKLSTRVEYLCFLTLDVCNSGAARYLSVHASVRIITYSIYMLTLFDVEL